jgi:nudix-type nucleoside diphosphatase (YffH/AdpP family)
MAQDEAVLAFARFRREDKTTAPHRFFQRTIPWPPAGPHLAPQGDRCKYPGHGVGPCSCPCACLRLPGISCARDVSGVLRRGNDFPAKGRYVHDRIRIRSVEVLSDGWTRLDRTVFDYRRLDGSWETQSRETYNRGDGACILPFDKERSCVLLVRQFRFPAYVSGHTEPLIEACAGLLDEDDPETCIRKEAEEELGYRLREVRHLYTPFMTPGSVTERLSFFTAGYSEADRVSKGGGAPGEGEDIEVLEMTLDNALAATGDGRIVDAKTIMLLQHLKLQLLAGA